MGHWKNYDELESALSLPELSATLNAMHDAEHRRNRFAASLKGIDLDKETGKRNDENPLEAAARRIREKAGNDIKDMVDTKLKDGSPIGIGIDFGYEEV